MLDKERARKIAIEYSKIVSSALNPKSIFLFGSYVNGKPNELSDIDVAVLVNDVNEADWYTTCVLLHRLRREGDFIDIEPHLLNVRNDPSGFVEHVIKTGEVIYQAT